MTRRRCGRTVEGIVLKGENDAEPTERADRAWTGLRGLGGGGHLLDRRLAGGRGFLGALPCIHDLVLAPAQPQGRGGAARAFGLRGGGGAVAQARNDRDQGRRFRPRARRRDPRARSARDGTARAASAYGSRLSRPPLQ